MKICLLKSKYQYGELNSLISKCPKKAKVKNSEKFLYSFLAGDQLDQYYLSQCV